MKKKKKNSIYLRNDNLQDVLSQLTPPARPLAEDSCKKRLKKVWISLHKSSMIEWIFPNVLPFYNKKNSIQTKYVLT
jgi:hypothetical protein